MEGSVEGVLDLLDVAQHGLLDLQLARFAHYGMPNDAVLSPSRGYPALVLLVQPLFTLILQLRLG